MLPDFIIIGAARCGTTSLYNYMISHPNIISASQKELHFFDLNFNKGLSWYESKFFKDNNKEKNFSIGESSPYYIYHPYAPYRISKIIPDVKLIAMLRNPIDRAYSNHQYAVKMKVENLSFEEAITKEHERLEGELEKMQNDENYFSFNHQNFSYLTRGIYVDQLKTWYNLFSKQQILVIRSEDFYDDSNVITNQVFEFLGIPKYKVHTSTVYNKGDYPSMSNTTRSRLKEFFKPHNEHLSKLLNKNFNWDN